MLPQEEVPSSPKVCFSNNNFKSQSFMFKTAPIGVLLGVLSGVILGVLLGALRSALMCDLRCALSGLLLGLLLGAYVLLGVLLGVLTWYFFWCATLSFYQVIKNFMLKAAPIGVHLSVHCSGLFCELTQCSLRCAILSGVPNCLSILICVIWFSFLVC